MSRVGQTAEDKQGVGFWLPVMAAVAGSLYFVGHSLWVIFGPEQRVMQWLYDDCFYYLITAKHFSEQHMASFDGMTVTSGYHPLWMWLCAAIYRLHSQLDLTYVRGCMLLALCISSGVLLAGLGYAIAKRQTGVLWALGIATTSYSALNNGMSAMEWPMVLLSWFLLHRVLVGGSAAESDGRAGKGLAAAFFVGMLGSFSRTDFGLIPFSYLAGTALAARRNGNWKMVFRAAASLAGAAAGLLLVMVYNHQMTGSWVQVSAAVKRLFASLIMPFNPAPALWQFLRVLLYLPPRDLDTEHRYALMQRGELILAVALLAAIVAAWQLRRRFSSAWKQVLGGDAVALAAAVGILGYTLLYAFDSQATYGWYTAGVTGFVVLLTARWLRTFSWKTAAAIVLPLMGCNIAAAQYFGGNARAQWSEVVIGKSLREEHPGARMGGGDVGKPSFYNGGTMVNLDGLMNNEVYPYLVAGKIECYLLKRRIEYLSDLGTITVPLVDAERARRHLPPFSREFLTPVAGPGGDALYWQTNFGAIVRSGECDAEVR